MSPAARASMQKWAKSTTATGLRSPCSAMTRSHGRPSSLDWRRAWSTQARAELVPAGAFDFDAEGAGAVVVAASGVAALGDLAAAAGAQGGHDPAFQVFPGGHDLPVWGIADSRRLGDTWTVTVPLVGGLR